jgi:hypothetical protein
VGLEKDEPYSLIVVHAVVFSMNFKSQKYNDLKK